MSATSIQWELEALGLVADAVGPMVGGGLVILATWIADRRRERSQNSQQDQRERTAFTGLFAVRNHVAQRLVQFEKTGDLSELVRLRTAQPHLSRFVQAAPEGSEALMISVLEFALKLDALLHTLELVRAERKRIIPKATFAVIVDEANELLEALHKVDLMAGTSLNFVSDEELKAWGTTDDVLSDADLPPHQHSASRR